MSKSNNAKIAAERLRFFPSWKEFPLRGEQKANAIAEVGRIASPAMVKDTQEKRAAAATQERLIVASKAESRKIKDVEPKVTKQKSKPTKPVKAAKSAISPDAVLTVLVDSFPHRAGSQAEAKSALLKTGMTVAEYQTAGTGLGLKGNWHLAHIKYCVSYNLISVEG